jgi:hypothetical protein
MVQRRIFGPKSDEGTGEWRKLHSGELYNLYSSPDIIRQIKSRRMRWEEHVACMGEGRNVYRVLVGKPEGKRPLGRPRRRWEDGIKMTLGGLVGGVECIHLAQDGDHWRAVVNAVMNLQFLAPGIWLALATVLLATTPIQCAPVNAPSHLDTRHSSLRF